MKILNWNYQRNGVAGEGFFQLIYRKKEDGFKKQMLFVVTFTTKNECSPNECIDESNCRVVTPDNPDLAWRGDRIAYSLQKDLIDMFGGVSNEVTFYDLMLRANETIK